MNSHFVFRPDCEICGSSLKSILISKPFIAPEIWDFIERYYASRVDREVLANTPYEIARCPRCGFMWQTYILNDHWMGVLYSQWIAADGSLAKKRQANVTVFADYAREIYAIGPLLGKQPHLIRVLDFGMGWGYWCLMAKAFGYEIYGAELSQERIDYAAQNGIPVLDLDSITEPWLDFINSEQVFEHIPHPLDQLCKLAKLLKPGGIIRISVPNAARKTASLADPAWRATKDAFHPLEHINAFTHQSLREMGRRAGLHVIPSPILPQFNPSLIHWIGARILRQKPAWMSPTTLYLTRDRA